LTSTRTKTERWEPECGRVKIMQVDPMHARSNIFF
jgi:hypothetical protein